MKIRVKDCANPKKMIRKTRMKVLVPSYASATVLISSAQAGDASSTSTSVPQLIKALMDFRELALVVDDGRGV
jgi:hypothetical protein